jgi:Protein of unknown function (DUF2845)
MLSLAEYTRPGDGGGLAVPTRGHAYQGEHRDQGPSSSRRRHRLIVAALFAGLAVSTVRADTFRCGTGLVRPGDTSFEVLKKCGRPTSQQQISGANERFVEQWYYEPGPTEFTRILTFVGTRLVNIETVTRP